MDRVPLMLSENTDSCLSESLNPKEVLVGYAAVMTNSCYVLWYGVFRGK